MALTKDVQFDDVEQGAIPAVINAVRELYPKDLTRALALPSVLDRVEGRAPRQDLYDAVDVDRLAELAEVPAVSGYNVRGDAQTGYVVTYSVFDESGVSRGFFPYEKVVSKRKAKAPAPAPAPKTQDPPNPQGDGTQVGTTVNPDGAGSTDNDPPPVLPESVKQEDYDALNVGDAAAFVANLSDEDRAAVLAYEAANKNRVGVLNAEGSS